MIGPVATLALPTLLDAVAPIAPIAAPGFAAILAIQSPVGAALPTLPAMEAADVADPVAAPVDFTIPATVIALPPIEPLVVPIAMPMTPVRPSHEAGSPSPNLAPPPVSDRLPSQDSRAVTDERDEDPAAAMADAVMVPIPAWLAPQPSIPPATAPLERKTIPAPVVDATVAPAPAEPQITPDSVSAEPNAARPLPGIPHPPRVTTVAAPRRTGNPAAPPIEALGGRTTTNLAPVAIAPTRPMSMPTPQIAAPDCVPPASLPPPTSLAQPDTRPDPIRTPVVETVNPPTAATPLTRVEHAAPDAGPGFVQPSAAERLAVPPANPPGAHPTLPRGDDPARAIDAAPVNAPPPSPLVPPHDAPAPAKPAPTAQPAIHDPLPAPTFAIATPALGEVSAAVTARHDGTGERLHVHFAVERDATAALIAGNDGLDRALAAAGTRLDTVSVEVRGSAERLPNGEAPRSDPRAPDPDRPRRPPPRSPQLRVAAPGHDRFA